jgi:hypothetical protein
MAAIVMALEMVSATGPNSALEHGLDATSIFPALKFSGKNSFIWRRS